MRPNPYASENEENRAMKTKRTALAAALVAASMIGSLALPSPAVAADLFALGAASGNAGATGVLLPLEATHDEGLQGFSLSASYNNALLTLTGLSFVGTATETISPGGTPDYVGVTIDNTSGTVVAGVIFGFDPVPPLNQIPQLPPSPQETDLLAYLVFDIDPGALPVTSTVQLIDGLGQPPVNNVYSNDGISYSPQLVNGTVSVNNLHRFYFDPIISVPGGSATAILRYDNEDPCAGFVVSLSYDTTRLTLNQPSVIENWWNGLDLDDSLSPDTIEFFDVRTVPAFPVSGQGYLALVAQFDFTGPFNGQRIEPGANQSLLRIPFVVANNVGLIGTSTTIHFENTISPAPAMPGGPIPPPTENLIVTPPGDGIFPVQEDGTVDIVAGPGFVRGNVNLDSQVNLADAIFLIQYLFTAGPTPGCLDAGDANDDGFTDISDAIYIINYLFTEGASPANPFPLCGLDATPDTLDCLASPPTCN